MTEHDNFHEHDEHDSHEEIEPTDEEQLHTEYAPTFSESDNTEDTATEPENQQLSEFAFEHDNDEEYAPTFAETSAADEKIEQAVARQTQRRNFEDYTLAEALGEFFRSPVQTVEQLHQVATASTATPITTDENGQPFSRPAPAPIVSSTTDDSFAPDEAAQNESEIEDSDVDYIEDKSARQREAFALGLRLTAFLIVWIGNVALVSVSRSGITTPVRSGLSYVVVGLVVWLVAELIASWGDLQTWWSSRQLQPDADVPPKAKNEPVDDLLPDFLHPVRIVLVLTGGLALIGTIIFNSNNQFTLVGFLAWMVSIIAFAGALASDEALFTPRSIRPKIPKFWRSGTFYALVAIVLIGAYFRFAYLDRTPPQMTSDHVEKLLDAQRVLDGDTQVFFPNNGGREPFQMYAMALLSMLPAFNIDFVSLKFLSALEGIVTLPFLWWMGREVIGRENPRLGNAVGLILVLLVAVSNWHVSISRLALRIILTPLISALVLIYLGRGMRSNRRDDWLKAGLALGAGLYMYQAVRMLPVVIIVGLVIAVIAKVRNRIDFTRYAFNFISLVAISFIIFVPMFVFSVQSPELFWRRTAGRLLGDAVIEEKLEDGTVISRDPTIGEQFSAFQENLPILNNNIKNVLLMFNWKGDVAWINNAPNIPQMDDIVGALFLLGLVAWLIRMFRHRDVVDWLIPAMIFIMLMPSALSIAYPIENPSATRTSGALPGAYLIAAYPLALMVRSLLRVSKSQRVAVGISAVLVGLIAFGSYIQNSNTYFTRYHNNYLLSSLPYKQAGEQLAQFNTQVGGRGNTFMIAYPYWWDHRALGLAAGMVDYPNGIVSLEDVPGFMYDSFLRQDKYRFDPNQNILFFHAVEDTATLQQLREWFPQGESEFVEIPQQNRNYAMYTVPALGIDRFMSFAQQNADIEFVE